MEQWMEDHALPAPDRWTCPLGCGTYSLAAEVVTTIPGLTMTGRVLFRPHVKAIPDRRYARGHRHELRAEFVRD